MLDPNSTPTPNDPQGHPMIGSKYSGSDYQPFTIQGVYLNNGSLWVHYVKDADSSEYNCTLEAFESRFQPMPS